MQVADAERNWGAASQVILGPEPALVVYGEAVIWLHKTELFRHEEETRMYRQEPNPDDLALHKRLLRRLIADGEHLVHLIEQHGLMVTTQRFSAEDVQATLRSLRADYRGWHEPLPAAERELILREVFNVTPTAP